MIGRRTFPSPCSIYYVISFVIEYRKPQGAVYQPAWAFCARCCLKWRQDAISCSTLIFLVTQRKQNANNQICYITYNIQGSTDWFDLWAHFTPHNNNLDPKFLRFLAFLFTKIKCTFLYSLNLIKLNILSQQRTCNIPSKYHSYFFHIFFDSD
jgi:hypothetical protein